MSADDHSKQCPICDSTTLDTDTDPVDGICSGCGLVYDDGEWADQGATSFDNEDQRDNQAESEADWQEEVVIHDASDQQLVRLLSQIDNLAEELFLSDEEHTRAAELAVEVWNRNVMHGRELESMLAGVVYVTCRELGQPRPSHVAAAAVETDTSNVQSSARVLVRELDLQIDPPGPKGYLSYLNRRLDLSGRTEQDALELLSETDNIGGNPTAIAAAACYVTTNDSGSLTLEEAGNAAGVTKETVWRHTTNFE